MKHFNQPQKSRSGLRRALPLLWALLISTTLLAQVKTITGSVTDATDGSGIPGATVKVMGTAQVVGTVTDIEGNYSIDVPSGAVALKFSFVGMESQELPINGNVINVVLSSGAIAVDEVVVIGFGSQKKESVVGSVVQASGEELLKAGTMGTVSEALSGILPGVSTMQATGQPGASQSTILIRGQSSWNNNSPLFMVDGVERDFNDIDPNEIESISVLKDASATAVFGVKGANGVILITTKRGKKGKAKVNFSTSYGLKVPTTQTLSPDYASTLELYNIAAMNDGAYNVLKSQEEIDMWRDPNRDMDYYSYTNWVERLIETGTYSAHNVNVSGGNDFVTYFTSLGYNHDGDIFAVEKRDDFDPRTYQNRYNWRSNLDFNFTKTTKVKVNLSGDFKDLNGNNALGTSGLSEGGSFLGRIYQTPMIGPPPTFEDGTVSREKFAVINTNYLAQIQNSGSVRQKSYRVYSDFILEQQLFDGLKFKGKISQNYNRTYKSEIKYTPVYYTTYEGSDGIEYYDSEKTVQEAAKFDSESIKGSGRSLYYEMSLAYNKKINDDHDVSALALFSRRNDKSGANFPSYEESWVGRATYGYKSKYLVEFNGAYNGSENWAPGLRFGFFPSMAAGWVLSEESFVKDNASFINFLKVRYSYGEVGTDYIKGGQDGRWNYISTYESNTSRKWSGGFGYPYSSIGTIYIEGKPANADGTWETAIKQNLGIELNVLENRLRFTSDLFNENRTGILMERRVIPTWYGNTNPVANIGETKTHGFDIELKWNDKIGENFNYFLKGNLSVSDNRIINRDDPKMTPEYQKQAGKPIGWIQGYLNSGYYNNWDDVYNTAPSTKGDVQPGDLMYVDYNGDGQISDPGDLVAIKDPSYAAKSFAFSMGASYKQLSFTALLNGNYGISKNLSDSYLFPSNTPNSLGFQALENEMLDYWTPYNTDAAHPILHLATGVTHNNTNKSSTYTVRNSSYIRLKSLEIKYKFKKETLNRFKIFNSFEVYVNGNNLLTFTKLPSALDPEAKKLEVYPLTKRYNIGLRGSF